MANKLHQETEDSFEALMDKLNISATEASSPAMMLELYRKENEFLRKKLDFYAHLNSHQLRAPLVQMMGLIDMLKKKSISNREKLLFDYLEIAAGNMDEMIRCINRVLQVEHSSPESED